MMVEGAWAVVGLVAVELATVEVGLAAAATAQASVVAVVAAAAEAETVAMAEVTAAMAEAAPSAERAWYTAPSLQWIDTPADHRYRLQVKSAGL